MLRIEANLPDGCGFEYRHYGTIKLLADTLPAEFSTQEIKDQIHLKQAGPMGRKEMSLYCLLRCFPRPWCRC